MWDLEIQKRKIIKWGPKVMKIGQLQAKILTFTFWVHTNRFRQNCVYEKFAGVSQCMRKLGFTEKR